MVNYPVYTVAPKDVPVEVQRYGVGYPFIHCVYDQTKEIDKETKQVKPKLNEEGKPIYHFTYHYTEQLPQAMTVPMEQ